MLKPHGEGSMFFFFLIVGSFPWSEFGERRGASNWHSKGRTFLLRGCKRLSEFRSVFWDGRSAASVEWLSCTRSCGKERRQAGGG